MVQRVSSFVQALIGMLMSLLRALLPQPVEDDMHALDPDDAEFETNALAVSTPVVAEIRPELRPLTGRAHIEAPAFSRRLPDDNWFMGSPRVLLDG
jgi:hypothetical protein